MVKYWIALGAPIFGGMAGFGQKLQPQAWY